MRSLSVQGESLNFIITKNMNQINDKFSSDFDVGENYKFDLPSSNKKSMFLCSPNSQVVDFQIISKYQNEETKSFNQDSLYLNMTNCVQCTNCQNSLNSSFNIKSDYSDEINEAKREINLNKYISNFSVNLSKFKKRELKLNRAQRLSRYFKLKMKSDSYDAFKDSLSEIEDEEYLEEIIKSYRNNTTAGNCHTKEEILNIQKQNKGDILRTK